MATDIGHLAAPHTFREWVLDSSVAAFTVKDEILERLRTHGLAYFENYGQLQRAVQAWETGINFNAGYNISFYLAAYYFQSGEQQRALDKVGKIIADCEADYSKTGRNSALNQKRLFQSFDEFLRAKTVT